MKRNSILYLSLIILTMSCFVLTSCGGDDDNSSSEPQVPNGLVMRGEPLCLEFSSNYVCVLNMEALEFNINNTVYRYYLLPSPECNQQITQKKYPNNTYYKDMNIPTGKDYPNHKGWYYNSEMVTPLSYTLNKDKSVLTISDGKKYYTKWRDNQLIELFNEDGKTVYKLWKENEVVTIE